MSYGAYGRTLDKRNQHFVPEVIAVERLVVYQMAQVRILPGALTGRVWISDGLVQGVAGWLVRIDETVPVMA